MVVMSEESRQKALETRKNNLKQVVPIEEQETIINLDYEEKTIYVYTSKASVINRLERGGYVHYAENYLDGEICSRSYKIPFKNGSKIVTGKYFL